MTEVQKARISNLVSFCGYGNPDSAKIFFMGIEEHNTYRCYDSENGGNVDDEISNLIEKEGGEYTYLNSDGQAKGTTEKVQLKIYERLSENIPEDKSQIFQSEIHCFNFYPLGAHKQKEYPPAYNKCFGFDFKSKAELYNYFDEQTRRNEILRQFIVEKIIRRKKLLFVFGKSCWEKAIKVLPEISFENDFDGWIKKRNHKPSMIRWSNDKTIWLTGHPSYGWINDEVINKIIAVRNDKS